VPDSAAQSVSIPGCDVGSGPNGGSGQCWGSPRWSTPRGFDFSCVRHSVE